MSQRIKRVEAMGLRASHEGEQAEAALSEAMGMLNDTEIRSLIDIGKRCSEFGELGIVAGWAIQCRVAEELLRRGEDARQKAVEDAAKRGVKP